MFEYSGADLEAQMAALPLVLRVWLQWMFAVIVLAPVVFVWHRQARVALLFSLVFLAVQLPLTRAVGLTNLLSLPHLLIWGPLVAYLSRELRARRIRPGSLFGIWALAAVATAIVSLVFDVRDFGRWLAGQRGIVQPGPAPEIPWLQVAAIALALGALSTYIFGRRPSDGRQRSRGRG